MRLPLLAFSSRAERSGGRGEELGVGRSALRNLQFAPNVEAGALLEHEGRHRLAPFRLEIPTTSFPSGA